MGVAAICQKIAASHGKTFAVSSAIAFPFAILRSVTLYRDGIIELTAFDSAHTLLASHFAHTFDHGENVIGDGTILYDVTGSGWTADSVRAAVVIFLETVLGSIAFEHRIRSDTVHRALSVVTLHLSHAGGDWENIAFGKAIVDGGASADRFADPVRGAEHLSPTLRVGRTFSRSDFQHRWLAFFGRNLGAVNAAGAFFAKESSHAIGSCVIVGIILTIRDVITFAHLDAGVGPIATVHVFEAVLDFRTFGLHGCHGDLLRSYEVG